MSDDGPLTELQTWRRALLRDPDDELARVRVHAALERALALALLPPFNFDEVELPAILGAYIVEEVESRELDIIATRFLAWDRLRRQPCRLAVLTPPFSRALGIGDSSVSELRTEARRRTLGAAWERLRGLQDPALCPPYEWGEQQGHFVVALSAPRGIPWRKAFPAAPSPALLRAVATIARALARVHAQSLLHGDLRADHLTLSEGTPRLAGFENRALLAVRPTPQGAVPQQVSPSAQLLPVASATPEEIQGDRLDPRSDVFQLGLLLYETLAGGSPYAPTPTVHELLRRIAYDGPPPPAERLPGLPAELAALLGRATARNPEDRFEGAAALAGALEDAARQMEVV